MLNSAMSLQDMISYRPSEADFDQIDETVCGLVRLCIVTTGQQEAYALLRTILGNQAAPFANRLFKDCLSTVFYDFNAELKDRSRFILIGELQAVCQERT